MLILLKKMVYEKKFINKSGNKIKSTKEFLRGSVYDLHPQDKAQKATLCSYYLISFKIHGTPIYRRIVVDKFGNQIKDYHKI
jgi:hypothetical protein